MKITMKRLSLAELKAQKMSTLNLEAIKGGNADCCHCVSHGPEDRHTTTCDPKCY